eukprot:180983_1
MSNDDSNESYDSDDNDDTGVAKVKIIAMPMNEFSGHMDEIRENIHYNLQQQLHHQKQQKRKTMVANVRSAMMNLMGWVGSNFSIKDTIVEEFIDSKYLEQLFTELDKDGGGSIDRNELFEGFIEQGAGDRFTEREITLIIDFMDKDGNGSIDFQEFIHTFGYMKIKSMQDLIEKSYLYILFRKIDTDGSGEIDFDELKSFFIQNHLKMKDNEILRLMKQVDEDG